MSEKKGWKKWSKSEKIELKRLCKQARSWKELEDLCKKSKFLMERDWRNSIRRKILYKSEWTKHFSDKRRKISREEERKSKETFLKSEEPILSKEEKKKIEEDKLLKELQKSPKSLKDISEMSDIDIAKEDVFPLIDRLRNRGYDIEVAVEWEGERLVFLRKEPIPGQEHRLAPITKREVKILVISDPCLGLRTEQGDLLATAIKIGEEEEVYIAIVSGNLSAGKPTPKKLGDYHLRTFEEQKNYIISHWPKAPFKTHFINGPSDLTHKTHKGQNIGYAIAQARNDLYYRGDKETIFLVGKDTRIAVVHTESDATVYTKSYPLQGVTENYQELIERTAENSHSPKVVLVGGTHSSVLIPPHFPFSSKKKRDICSINIPSLYGMTATQRARRRRGGSPVLGCWILTFKFDKEGNLKDVIWDSRDLTAYQKSDDYLEEVKIKPDLSLNQVKILEFLSEEPRTRGEISRTLHKSTSYVQKVVDELKKKGYKIVFDTAEKRYKLERGLKAKFKPLSLKNLYVKRAKTLNFSDTHIGHKKSRLDLIPKAYEVAEEEKVDEVHFDGDLSEGLGLKHKQLIKGEIEAIGADKQLELGLSVWPKSKIPTKLILGAASHDFDYLEATGHNIAKTFAKVATSKKLGKIEFIGEDGIWCRGITEINGIGYMLFHPSGGIPFGLTYRGQINIEKLIPMIDEDFSARILEVGHLHIALFMQYKGMVCLFVPALQEQTQYLAARGLFPWIGFWVTETFTDNHGNITRVVLRYIPFEPRKKKKNNKKK